jgi:predicted kinase
MFTSPQKVVLVSGAPGAGKTTLAVPLARALNFTLIVRDDIKETLYEALDGRPNDLEFSRKVGAASWEVLWTLASKSPEVILESNFRPNHQIEQGQLAALNAQFVEVHCYCPPEEIMRRFARRSAVGDRHYAHPMSEITAEQIAEFDGWMGFGALIEVDTSSPVDIPSLARQINYMWK